MISYDEYLRALSPDDFRKFIKELGGDTTDPEHIVAWVAAYPDHERLVCQKIFKVFNVTVRTAAERKEAYAKSVSEAAGVQAASAKEANLIAKEANKIAKCALWVGICATILSVCALIISIIKKH
jgi:hypothetical protein